MVKQTRKERNEDRTVLVNFKVTPYEKELIENDAKKRGLTVAQLIRGNLFMGMVMDGNVDVLKYVSSVALAEMTDKMKSLVDVFSKKDVE